MCPMSFMLFTVLSFLHINLKLQRFVPDWRPSVDVQSCLVVRVEGTDYFREPEEESTFSLFLLLKPPAHSSVILCEKYHASLHHCLLLSFFDMMV